MRPSLLQCSFCIALISSSAYATIYGKDDRVDIERVAQSRIQLLSQPVAAQVDFIDLHLNEDGSYNLSTTGTLKDYEAVADQPLCREVPFQKQPLIAHCTGSLITSQLILTAGHCVEDSSTTIAKDPTKLAWVFGFRTTNGHYDFERVPREKIRFGSRILQWKDAGFPFEKGVDYALVLLERPVPGVKPIAIDFSKPVNNTPLMTSGFPTGLPMKWVRGGSLIMQSDTMIGTTLDLFKGNSGSLILDETTGKAVGIYSWTHAGDWIDKNENGKSCVGLGRLPLNAQKRFVMVVKKYGGIKELDYPRVDPEFLTNCTKVGAIPNLKKWMLLYP